MWSREKAAGSRSDRTRTPGKRRTRRWRPARLSGPPTSWQSFRLRSRGSSWRNIVAGRQGHRSWQVGVFEPLGTPHPASLDEYQKKRLVKFAIRNRLILKGATLVG